MSKTNDNHITRQWYIIQFLIGSDSYVSSDAVFSYLQQAKIDVKDVRTVQRDLNTLAEIFPIECRKDDKPYGWRWQRVDSTKKSAMSYEQAMIFTLVDSKLREFIPNDLLDRLSPLFIRARMMLAGIDYQRSRADDLSVFTSKNGRSPHGFIGPNISPLDTIFGALGGIFNPFKENSDALESWRYMVKVQDIHQLETILSENGYADLVKKLKGFDKNLKVVK